MATVARTAVSLRRIPLSMPIWVSSGPACVAAVSSPTSTNAASIAAQ